MRVLPYILLTLVGLLSGCSHEQSDTYRYLLDVERMVSKEPNRAMQMIYAMEVANRKVEAWHAIHDMECERLETEVDSALFGLLYTEVIHKIGMEIRDDSLIAMSTRYYEKKGDRDRLARSLLHLGITHQSNDRWREAVACLKRAEELSVEMDDSIFSYDVCDAIGHLNEMANCKDLMLTYYQRALAWADMMGNDSLKVLTLNKMIRAQVHLGMVDSARAYITQAQPLLSSLTPQLRSDLLASIGSFALIEQDTVKATRYLTQALQLFPNDYAAKLMGDVMEGQGKMKEATDYWFEALNTDHVQVKIEAYEKLVDYYKHHEEWRALDLSDHLNHLYQNMRSNDKAETIAALQKEYDSRMERHRFARRLIILTAVILVLVVAIVLFVYYHRRKMRAYQVVQDRIKVLQDQLSEKKEKESVADMQLMDTLLNDTTVYYFHRMASGGRVPDNAQWKELYDLIQRVLPDFLPSVNRNGLLTERDLRICMLIKLRFVPTEIATLIGLSPQSVTNSRTRLLRTIFGVKGGARDFDARIQQLKD
jgi:tetratricopeptide (TPR) repeat protein